MEALRRFWKMLFTKDRTAASGIVIRHLHFKYYLNRALFFVDPYIHAEYKIVSRSARLKQLYIACCMCVATSVIGAVDAIGSAHAQV